MNGMKMKILLTDSGTVIGKDKTKKIMGGNRTIGSCSGRCSFDLDCGIDAGCRCKYKPATGGGRSECYSLFS
jgi:hypothetical protein